MAREIQIPLVKLQSRLYTLKVLNGFKFKGGNLAVFNAIPKIILYIYDHNE